MSDVCVLKSKVKEVCGLKLKVDRLAVPNFEKSDGILVPGIFFKTNFEFLIS